MKEPIVYIKIILNLLFVILAALFVLLILPRIIGFFLPFVIGWIIAMIANPLVKFLEKRVKILRKHSSAIIIIIVIIAIAGIAYLIVTKIVHEASELNDELENITEQFTALMNDVSERLRTVSKKLPESIQSAIDIDELLISIENYISNFLNDMELPSIGSAGKIVKNVTEGFLFVLVTILSAYFFAANRNELIAGLRKLLPQSVIDGWVLIYGNFKSAVGGYFKAQFKIMLLLSLVMFAGFEIMRIDFSFLLALGIAFLDFLPVLGTGAVLWPWALIDLIAGNYMRAVGMLIIYLICQVLKQVLQPKMVGDSIGLNPLATLAFMYIGYRFYGIVGIIFGVPAGMVLVNLYRVGMFDRMMKGFKIIVHDLNNFRKF